MKTKKFLSLLLAGALALSVAACGQQQAEMCIRDRFLLPLMERLPGTPCQLASDCVDSVRARKDAAEQELMRMNSRLNDEAMTQAADYIREGMTEAQVADFLLAQYKELGCQDVSFPPICLLYTSSCV